MNTELLSLVGEIDLDSGIEFLEPVAYGPELFRIVDRLTDLATQREQLPELSQRALAFLTDNTQEIWLERRIGWTRGLMPEQDLPR